MNRLEITVLGMAASLVALTPARAGEPIVVEGGQSLIRVSYTDLNLATRSGIDTLDARVRAAAKRLCRAAEPGDMLPVQHACTDGTVALARPQIDRAVARLASRDFAVPAVQVALRK